MFFDTFLYLCNQRGIAPSAAVVEMGFQKSVATRWKNGTIPRDANLMKVADYFGVTVEYLLNGETTETKKDEITFDDFTYAMYNESRELLPEEKEMLLDMAKLMKEKRKNKQ